MQPDRAQHTGPNGRPRQEEGAMRIIHCLRSPVGGLFRHVQDLVAEQARAGHKVGIICDSSTGDGGEKKLVPLLELGLIRIPMRRDIAPGDLSASLALARRTRPLMPDVLHGHGAKGGAYARAIGTLLRASGQRVARIYTPHGGSLHFDAKSASGRLYMASERVLGWMTDAFIFVSRYEADAYLAKVGHTRRPTAVVRNGLRPEEFAPVKPDADARDFLFIGEVRDLKGPDTLIAAIALIARHAGPQPTALIVGSGPDLTKYRAVVRELGLGEAIEFRSPMPAREAFRLARAVVVPSRAESMPYVVLEAIAAQKPIVATNVGGIPEIFGGYAARLVPADDPSRLAEAMNEVKRWPDAAADFAGKLSDHIHQEFTIEAMARGVERVYRAAITIR
jgi:glycosyltransferase involved in cell wall biosynthesis